MQCLQKFEKSPKPYAYSLIEFLLSDLHVFMAKCSWYESVILLLLCVSCMQDEIKTTCNVCRNLKKRRGEMLIKIQSTYPLQISMKIQFYSQVMFIFIKVADEYLEARRARDLPLGDDPSEFSLELALSLILSSRQSSNHFSGRK